MMTTMKLALKLVLFGVIKLQFAVNLSTLS